MIEYRIHAFKDDFDFHNDCLPKSLVMHFDDQLHRAQQILVNRNQTEILYAIDLLDWMFFEGNRLGLIHTTPATNVSRSIFANRVKALKQLKESGQIDISEENYFPNARWSDYFAVMSLVYIAEILHSYEYLLEHGQMIMETDVPRIMEWAIESMDSVCSAELYLYQEDKLFTHPDSNKADKQHGILIHNKNFAEIKNDIICRYSGNYEHSDITNREAAIRIVDDLKETRFCSERFAYETIERWIEQYKKGIFISSCESSD